METAANLFRVWKNGDVRASVVSKDEAAQAFHELGYKVDRVTGAISAAQARERLQDQPDFDLMLLDLMLGEDNGFDLLTEFRADHPRVPVVVLSASESKDHVLRALDLGAMGYITKRAASAEVVSALRIVLSGGL